MAESSIQRFKERLSSLLHQKDMSDLKAKMLEEQADRDRQREAMMSQIVQQLMDRQREMNIMLNRANLMLNRAQETNMVLSLEFTELVHALPAPDDENTDVKERIQRINDLFKKTGVSDADITGESAAGAAQSVIVTPPPGEEVIERETIDVQPAAYHEEQETEESDEIDLSSDVSTEEANSLLDELFRRTGDEHEEPAKSRKVADLQTPEETQPVDMDAPAQPEPIETASPVEPEPIEIVTPVEPWAMPVEPVAEEEPSTQEPHTEPVVARDRRWWQLIGRR